MCVALPEKSFKYALVCSVGSIFGGCLGYLIGWQFMASVGIRIVDFYGLTGQGGLYRNALQHLRRLGRGHCRVHPHSLQGVHHRRRHVQDQLHGVCPGIHGVPIGPFFLVGGLIYLFGPRIQHFIDRYFNLLAVTFTVLLVGSFVLIKYLF
jgi:hypothetical protein